MKKILKWIGVILGGLVVVLAIVTIALHFAGRSRMTNAPQVTLRPVTVPTDAAGIAHGEHLVNVVTACRECHGEKLNGEVFIDGEMGAYVASSNLTSGRNGVGGLMTDADWERAIRHGIGHDGRALAIMPSTMYSHLSDADMGALIAYLKTVPPADSDVRPTTYGFPGSILFGFLAFDEFTHVNRIDHAAVGANPPAEGATAEYGEYLTYIGACRECHGGNLAGNFTPETTPMGPNLTTGGELTGWSQADFNKLLRTGVTPEGEQIDGEEMPWGIYSQMSDAELEALWMYLSELPPLPNNAP